MPVSQCRTRCVELREPGWVIHRTPAVAAVQADHQGAFNLPNPPVGDYSIVGIFPDGEADAGGWPAVAIAAGEEITGVLVPLERKLVLLSPVGGVTVAASPTLAWQAAEGAESYRLWVIDAGTTALVLDQIVTGATAPITRTLEPGTYTWVVNGLNAAGDLVASGTDTFVVQGEAASPAVTPQAAGAAEGLPPTCQPQSGQSVVYADRQRGFCFLYPAGFAANAIDPGQINVIGVVQGPALDASPDPLAATLLIEVMPDGSADLEAAVAAMVREFHGQPGVNISQHPFDLGGLPAVLLEGVPGRGGSRDVVALLDGMRFRLLFMPDPEGFPAVAEDLQALFDAVTRSFTFFIQK